MPMLRIHVQITVQLGESVVAPRYALATQPDQVLVGSGGPDLRLLT